MRLTKKQVESLRTYWNIQGADGNWNYDVYMQGMFNGIEIMMAVIEKREPEFRNAPEKWLKDVPATEKVAVIAD